ncbi:hypothetical protein, partial [Segatella baroniae]|uniref:hypothetical protein n=1 Tax=Segatella baroniae TaxID=305719 RepID=UPI0028E49DB2
AGNIDYSKKTNRQGGSWRIAPSVHCILSELRTARNALAETPRVSCLELPFFMKSESWPFTL